LFRYVVDNWLLGEMPPAFDLLAWNDDATRIPGKAHSYFARKMYLENALANDTMEALGERLIVSNITTDTYIVAAVEDHIVPWQTSYKSTQLFKGPVRFVLSSGGHIAGIVNPPGPRARLWTNEELPNDPERWRAAAAEQKDSWWNDWAGWIGERAGGRVLPPGMGSLAYPPLCDAPGTYVTS
jgi:polyhydroxyalkanoate synthase